MNQHLEKSIKVVYLIESLARGGKERRLVELVLQLSNSKIFQIHLVLNRSEIDFNEIRHLNLPIYFLSEQKSKVTLNTFVKLFKIMNRIRPDIVHTWGGINSLIAILLKPFFGYVIVNSQITAAPAYVKRSFLFHKLPFAFSDVITANSKAGLLAYDSQGQKSKVIYNGFDFKRVTNLPSSDSVKTKFGIASQFVVGMFSNLTPAKDYPIFFTIAEKILNERDDITFICAGKGDFTDLFASLSKKARLRFQIMGPLENVEEVMSTCDIGLQLTNTNGHGEGISNSILELCALGKCVIATDCGGSPEIIENGVSGFLVDNNADSISDLIELLFNDGNKRTQIGNNAREVIKLKFSIERMVEEFRQIYEGSTVK